MKFCVIASGSSGNITYVEGKSTKLLIDAGISLPNAQKRIEAHQVDLKEVDYILITHEHGDHISFLATLAKKIQATIFISRKSFMAISKDTRDKMIGLKVCFIEGESKYKIGDFEVLTLSLSHDTKEIFGFILIENGKKLAYLTDTGIFPVRYYGVLKDIDAIIIEANHDVQMLQESDRDITLKRRILSSTGHLSNKTCYEILEKLLTDKYKYVILAHISRECNSVECIKRDIINKVNVIWNGKIVIASQDECTELMEI